MKNTWKPAILILSFTALIMACQTSSSSSSGTASGWAWMSGESVVEEIGIYGTQGIAAASNVPGARDGAASWIDSSGNLWLFGGTGLDSVGNLGGLNDLWEYSPATLEWTWMFGSSTVYQAGSYGTLRTAGTSNVPGAREGAVSWIDANGKLWLFGGTGHDSAGNLGALNDLWKYDPSTLEWTWMSGSDTVGQAGNYGTPDVAVPGARSGAISWVNSTGNFWLFGGWGYDISGNLGWLNDLWEYNPSTLEWTWVSGSSSSGEAGIYGTMSTAATTNVPGGRDSAVSWIDSSGNLWLFGGDGLDSAGAEGWLNDLWEFDPATLEWTWVSGSSSEGQSGTYGTQGSPASSNVPGARHSAVSWIDSSGNLWLFGGWGYDSASNQGWLNDLWRYVPAAQEWTWVSGASSINQSGIFGVQGTASTSNVPGARDSAVSWIDSSGNLWLFGGNGLDATGNQGWLNDLWRYTQ